MNNKYDLQQRTQEFSIQVIKACKRTKLTDINRPIINQLVRSATSVGANYREATGASSKKDFRHKIFICKKEAQETDYWIDILVETEEKNEDFKELQDEINQLVKIFHTIAKNSAE